MKSLILLLLTMIVSFSSNAQNLIGKTEAEIEKTLKEKPYRYETYFTTAGNKSYWYEDDENLRIYTVSPSRICTAYMLFSNDPSFMFEMRGYLERSGYVLDKSYQKDYGVAYKKPNNKLKAAITSVDMLETTDEQLLKYTNYMIIYQTN